MYISNKCLSCQDNMTFDKRSSVVDFCGGIINKNLQPSQIYKHITTASNLHTADFTMNTTFLTTCYSSTDSYDGSNHPDIVHIHNTPRLVFLLDQ